MTSPERPRQLRADCGQGAPLLAFGAACATLRMHAAATLSSARKSAAARLQAGRVLLSSMPAGSRDPWAPVVGIGLGPVPRPIRPVRGRSAACLTQF